MKTVRAAALRFHDAISELRAEWTAKPIARFS
jgi:hypothetical protein